MKPKNESKPFSRGLGPELEQTPLTPKEEKVFLDMAQDFLSGTQQETNEFLEGHRSEEQGE